jgi:hypothetical protein
MGGVSPLKQAVAVDRKRMGRIAPTSVSSTASPRSGSTPTASTWPEEELMGRCDVCGNDYHRTMEIKMERGRGTFDSFECAIHRLAPVCEHCGCRVIGHGVELGERIFCCANCAQMEGIDEKAVNA